MKTQDIKSLTIIGRRWFEKVNGNTYFSAIALINGSPVSKIDFEYGYSNQFEVEMYRKLIADGIIADNKVYAYRFCIDNNIAYFCTVTDVSSKKQLKF